MNNEYFNVPSVTFARKYEAGDRLLRSADSSIRMTDYSDDSLILVNVSKGGRQLGFGSAAILFAGLMKKSVYNFGADGETVAVCGNGDGSINLDFSQSIYGDYYADIVDIGAPSFMDRASIRLGSTIGLQGAGEDSDILFIAISNGGRCADFCVTLKWLRNNTAGTVLNFGSDGEILIITGDGNSGFTIESPSELTSSVTVSIFNLSRNAKNYETRSIISDALIASGSSIELSFVTDIYDLFFVCIYQNGRQAGFFSTGVDLINAFSGFTRNFGVDGQIVEIVGNGKNRFSITPSNMSTFNLSVTELVLPHEFHAGGIIQINTFVDFHLVPKGKIGVNPAIPNYFAVSIPGTSKRYDFTEYLSTGLTRSNRSGSWEFFIDHNLWPDWIDYYTAFERFLNGYKVTATLSEDPNRSYEGYVTVNGYSAGDSYSSVSITYDFDVPPTTSLSYAPIRFIKSDGTYYEHEYVFTPGTEYVIQRDIMIYGEPLQALFLTDGLYSLTPVPVGKLVGLGGIQDKNQFLVLSISANGRFCNAAGIYGDIISIKPSEIFNFGFSGDFSMIAGNGYSGIFPYTSRADIDEVYVTVTEPEVSYIINRSSVNVGAYMDLISYVNDSRVLMFSVTSGRLHTSFCATARDICRNTSGSLYSFGVSGGLLNVTGDGASRFKIEATDEAISNLFLTIAVPNAEMMHESESFKPQESIDLWTVPNDDSLVLVSASSGNRMLGFCATKHDIINSTNGKIFNMGSDGCIAEIVGDGYSGFSFQSDIYDENTNVSVSIAFI